ncbi:MAG: SWIM zinc finger family protein, partial [Treponema sp.]|nr:SWIM zinc finger family protein [Treponema sp.]
MSDIIDLRETSPNRWQAKYQGNYGVYTIKIATDGKHRGEFSCTCPSDYYPCKHIAIIEEAIAERIAKYAGEQKSG